MASWAPDPVQGHRFLALRESPALSPEDDAVLMALPSSSGLSATTHRQATSRANQSSDVQPTANGIAPAGADGTGTNGDPAAPSSRSVLVLVDGMGNAHWEERPVHRPPAPGAPIPGTWHYAGCDPDRPRVNPDGRCEGCGERACPDCGLGDCLGCEVA